VASDAMIHPCAVLVVPVSSSAMFCVAKL